MARMRPYTLAEAAKQIGIARVSVLKAIRAGRLKAKLKIVHLPQRIWQINPRSVESYEVSSSHRERGLKNPQ